MVSNGKRNIKRTNAISTVNYVTIKPQGEIGRPV